MNKVLEDFKILLGDKKRHSNPPGSNNLPTEIESLKPSVSIMNIIERNEETNRKIGEVEMNIRNLSNKMDIILQKIEKSPA